ncbi:MAG: queuosine precursor transporter [Bacteroidales bacterium]|nr:queuosine precursor transporter [Bacteroidales bacterium]
MSNEILFFITAITSFLMVILAFRLYGKAGIFIWLGFATVVANIEVIKCVDIFGLPVTLGNVLYGSTFLCTDILSELFGGKVSRRSVRMGFYALICFTVLMQIALAFIPNDSDFASPAMHELFSLSPRICIASLLAYLISNTLDTYTFDWIGKHTKILWLKNNGSTMTSQLVDSILFTFGAFYGLFEMKELWLLVLTTYIIKVFIAMIDTPFVYWARKIWNEKHEELENKIA